MPVLPPVRPAVLVVDDEEPLLRLTEAALQELGFPVLAAVSGEEALELAGGHDGPIGLLVLDVVMPDINGPELFELLRARDPEARVIFTSGYGMGAVVALRQHNPGAHFLTKPFGLDQLRRTVEAALR